MNFIPKWSIVALSLAVMGQTLAQEIALTGKVSDSSGKGLVGAIVRLKSNSLADTTDGTGAYAITSNSTALHDAQKNGMNRTVTWNNGALYLSIPQTQTIQIDLFDLNGNRMKTVLNQKVEKGDHRILVPKDEQTQNIHMVRVTIGKVTTQFLASPVSSEKNSRPWTSGINSASNLEEPLRKAGAVDDALEASAVGFKSKTIPITAYTGAHNITLESDYTGTCTASKSVNNSSKGSGTHSVVVETNSDAGIKEGTIYRPSDLGPGKKYPIVVWGEGACSLNGLSNSASMAEIASHGYFVVADGTPNGSGSRAMDDKHLDIMGAPALAYITWAIAENRKPCSAYYQSLDTSKIGANGFSCGGLISMGTAKDPRMTTWGLSSSGSFQDNPTLWNSVHTPVIMIEGEKDETNANVNGLRDFTGLSPLGHPVYYITNKTMIHGGDLNSTYGGHFTKIHLAWLNWWLKGDTGATGKGVLVGSTCNYCTNPEWIIQSANIP